MNQRNSFKVSAGHRALALLPLFAIVGCDQDNAVDRSVQAPAAQSQVQAAAPLAEPAANAPVFEDVHPQPAPAQLAEADEVQEGHIPVSINFVPRVGNRNFVCGQVYSGVSPSQASVQPVDFRFFVHNLRLINDQGQEVPVTVETRAPWQGQAVALLDFENNQGECELTGDAQTNAQVTGSIPEGNYQGLRFSLGVPTPVNHADPAQSGEPFQAGGMAWNWTKGFKFMNVEVHSVPEAAGQEPSIGKFHLGSTACTNNEVTQEVECSKPNRGEVFLPNFRLGQDNVVADIGALFANSALSTSQICHSGQDACEPLFAQVGVDWDSGAPAAQQQVFTSEGRSSAPAPLLGGSGLAFMGLGIFGVFAAGRRARSRD